MPLLYFHGALSVLALVGCFWVAPMGALIPVHGVPFFFLFLPSGLMGCPAVCFCVLVRGVPLYSSWWPDPWGVPFVFSWGTLSVLALGACVGVAPTVAVFWFMGFLSLVSSYFSGLVGCPAVCFCVRAGVPLCSFW